MSDYQYIAKAKVTKAFSYRKARKPLVADKSFPAVKLSAEEPEKNVSHVTGQDTKEIYAQLKQFNATDSSSRQVRLQIN